MNYNPPYPSLILREGTSKYHQTLQSFQHLAKFYLNNYSLKVATCADCTYDLVLVTEPTLDPHF